MNTTTATLLETLRTMNNTERLEVIALATQLIREDLSGESLERRAWEKEEQLRRTQTYRTTEELTEWSVTG